MTPDRAECCRRSSRRRPRTPWNATGQGSPRFPSRRGCTPTRVLHRPTGRWDRPSSRSAGVVHDLARRGLGVVDDDGFSDRTARLPRRARSPRPRDPTTTDDERPAPRQNKHRRRRRLARRSSWAAPGVADARSSISGVSASESSLITPPPSSSPGVGDCQDGCQLRPACSVDATVPGLTPIASATSCCSRSSTYRNAIALALALGGARTASPDAGSISTGSASTRRGPDPGPGCGARSRPGVGAGVTRSRRPGTSHPSGDAIVCTRLQRSSARAHASAAASRAISRSGRST